jgi:uncharacterized protein YggE
VKKSIKILITVFLALILISLAGCIGDQPPELSQTEEQVTDSTPSMVDSKPALDLSSERLSVEVVSPQDFTGPSLGTSDQDATERGIVVSGQGKIGTTPDLAVFTVGVITTEKTSQEAITGNANIMNSVINSLKSSGIEDKDIKTQTVSVFPQFDYGSRDERLDIPRIVGYRAENRVSVTVRDIGNTGEVVDASIAAGANQLYGISFTVSEKSNQNLRALALKMAVQDATDKARAIADAMGVERISPIKVVESGGYTPPIFRFDVAAVEEGGLSTPISPGESELTASVTMTFGFKL